MQKFASEIVFLTLVTITLMIQSLLQNKMNCEKSEVVLEELGEANKKKNVEFATSALAQLPFETATTTTTSI